MKLRAAWRPAAVLILAVAASAVGGGVGVAQADHASSQRAASPHQVKIWKIHYRAHNGTSRAAWVVLPAWYGPGRNPPIPLIVSPHGRGLSGRANAAIWGALPAAGPFAVVNPDGQGRLL